MGLPYLLSKQDGAAIAGRRPGWYRLSGKAVTGISGKLAVSRRQWNGP